jgi:RNA polymerase sigma-70 factor (ECF subfamily)
MEQTLVAAAQAAPRPADLAFERLYRSSRDDVYAYVAGLLRDPTAAEEATAAAFERAYRKRNRFDPERGELRAWLFGIARNTALDELRRRGRQAELTTGPIDLGNFGPRDGDEDSERRRAVSGALECLQPAERELIALKFFAGLGNSEIAQVLGVSDSNVGTKLHRVMTKLREACDGTA